MNVTLTPQLEAMIRGKVESGRYASESEVVQEALRLLEDHDRRAELRAAIAIGEEQYRRGEVARLTPELMEEIKRESERLAKAGATPDPDVCPR